MEWRFLRRPNGFYAQPTGSSITFDCHERLPHVSIETLDGEWKSVEGATAAEKAAMRFFKVVVELP